MKRIIFSIILLLLSASCVKGIANINFSDVDKGDIVLEIDFSKKYFNTDQIEKLVSDLEKQSGRKIEHKFQKEGNSKDFGDYLEYAFTAKFNNLNQFKDLVGIFNRDPVKKENDIKNIYITRNEDIVEVSLGTSPILSYKITVPGKILEVSNGGKISGSTITFIPGVPMYFKYKKGSDIKRALIVALCCIPVLVALYVYNKKEKKGEDD